MAENITPKPSLADGFKYPRFRLRRPVEVGAPWSCSMSAWIDGRRRMVFAAGETSEAAYAAAVRKMNDLDVESLPF